MLRLSNLWISRSRILYKRLSLTARKEIMNSLKNIIQPFIIFISGVSGSGKTTLLKNLCPQLPETTVCLHFDSIGVPSTEQMIQDYGSPRAWQEAMTQHWVNIILTNYYDKALIILEGQVNFDFIEEACKKNNFKNYSMILVHCNDVVRHERLRNNRNQPELINQDMDNWAHFLYTQALNKDITILNSEFMGINEMVKHMLNQIKKYQV